MKCPMWDNAFCQDEECYTAGRCRLEPKPVIDIYAYIDCPTYRIKCALPECIGPKVCKYHKNPANGNGPKAQFYCEQKTTFESCAIQCTACKLYQDGDFFCSSNPGGLCLDECKKAGRCLKSLPSISPGMAWKKNTEPTHVGATTQMAATTTYSAPPCHYGVYHLGNIGKASIWVGKEYHVNRRPTADSKKDFALIVSLIEYGTIWGKDNKGDEFLVSGNAAAKELLPRDLFRHDKPIPFLHVSWPDYGAVGLGRDWWASFVETLKRIEGDVVLYCVGGHGRTGTAAAILASMAGWVPKDSCPVAWVRDVYCPNTVESEAQCEYIEHITGCKVYSWPSKDFTRQKQLELVATTSKPVVKEDDGDRTPFLSKNRYKKHAARIRRGGGVAPHIHDLDDRYEVVVDGQLFEWNAAANSFDWIVEVGDGSEEGEGRDESGSGPEMVG